MASSIPNFDEKLESWDSYKERLEHYFIALDIEDQNKKKSILINCVGPGNYERIRNLCFPSSVNDKEYEELLKIFGNLFTPSIVIFKERKEFYNARKYKTEKATAWHERVCRLAINCKFGTRTEETLLDKFVTAFDGVVFERFCEEGSDLALSKALEIAQRYETIEAPRSVQKPEPKKYHQKNDNNHQKQPNQKQHPDNQPGHSQKPKKIFVPRNVNKPTTKVEVNLNVKKN
ncbi:uncharacterized protein LOC129938563 [Eupeodes corollae]|uniref:uncharacterized protein LOC129938563 n=1 Tax=Eupeodes corollae TaxID=290404 RepID=UPI0024923957|nr:uncharacterized protein LOC129938563 [Eupeodes corollae]